MDAKMTLSLRIFIQTGRNVEIKARLTEGLESFRKRVELLNPREEVKVLYQTDTFFKVPEGRLKLREFGEQESELIYYKRPDKEGPKISDYEKTRVLDAEGLKKTLSKALGALGILSKTRFLYLIGQTRVHCDSIEGLGNFMELEVCLMDHESPEYGEAVAKELMKSLGVEKKDLISGAYVDLKKTVL